MKNEDFSTAIAALLLGLILLAFAIRIHRLDFQSLWRDEVDAIRFAQRGLSELAANFLEIGQNGPLYFLLLHYWIRLAGTSEFAVRFFSLAFGVLIIPLIHTFGRQLLGTRTGLLAALLVALSPYHIWYSQEAKMYSLVAFLALLSLYLFLLALRKDRPFLWASYVLVTSLSLYIHIFCVLMILVECLWFVLLWRAHRTTRRNASVGLACLVVPYLPIGVWQLPLLLSSSAETGYYPYGLREMLEILLSAFSLGLRPSGGLFSLSFFAFVFLAGLIYGKTRVAHAMIRGRRIILVFIYVFLPVTAVYLVSLRRPTFTDRYLILILPGYYLVLACGLLAIKRRAGFLFALCLSLAVLLSLRGVWVQDHTKIKADFRAAVQFFGSQAQEEDLVVFVMPYVRHAFSYYYPKGVHWIEPPNTNSGMSEGKVASAMEEATRGYDRAWLFLSEADSWDSRGLVEKWFEDHAKRMAESKFNYIELRCYRFDPGMQTPSDAAMAAYEQAAQLSPNDPEIYVLWGEVYYDMGRYVEAAQQYEVALGIHPYHTQAHSCLGDAYLALGQAEQARQAYEQAKQSSQILEKLLSGR